MATDDLPGDRRTPVVTDKMRVGQAERVEQSDDVGYQVLDLVGIHPFGACAGGVTALIRCDYAVARCGEQWCDLAPGCGALREAMQRYQRNAVVRARDQYVEGEVANGGISYVLVEDMTLTVRRKGEPEVSFEVDSRWPFRA